jgi:hypothetical protein
MHEVDEITNIVTDVVGDPTLPRLVTQIFFCLVRKTNYFFLVTLKPNYVVVVPHLCNPFCKRTFLYSAIEYDSTKFFFLRKSSVL